MIKKAEKEVETYPMVPIRDVVIFPFMMVPFVIGRSSSVKALEEALGRNKQIFLATQKDATQDNPGEGDIYRVGTIATIAQSIRLPDGNIRVLVEGNTRARALVIHERDEFLEADVEIEVPVRVSPSKLALVTKQLNQLLEEYSKLNPNSNYETVFQSVRKADAERLADTIAATLPISVEDKQDLLGIIDPVDRISQIIQLVDIEIEKINMEKSIQGRVRKGMEKAQREYYLNEKIKAINKELGRDDKNEIQELRDRVANANMPESAEAKALQEIRRLEAMPPMSAETTVSRSYIEWLISLPWTIRSEETADLSRAEEILNEDHYGLEKIKERILEFLAVRQLLGKSESEVTQGSTICFIGPPGVGKTSLGKSIARATGRKFVRHSLGGVRDEAEIRGHRRTYVGSLPGQIIQMMKRAGTRNPVFLLDEIDKMSSDFRGDPASALMEVLDPEHNNSFLDHYLDTEFDLSEVLFVCTANVLHTIPRPLQDRMEIIELSGYTEQEKVNIARQYLVPKQRELKGLSPENIVFEDEGIVEIIRHYTRESGVRNMEREIGNIMRKLARMVISDKGQEKPLLVNRSRVNELLGIKKYRQKQTSESNEIGLVVGLAWTEVGGEILMTEATTMKGKGVLELTGKLGEVMQESAKAALSWIRSRWSRLGLEEDLYKYADIHVHVPEGAIPKDGPSAGITIATAMVSALLKVPVRRDVAMTGEITLRGKVLPIGGVKEKILAAHRAGLSSVILPAENEKDLVKLPEEVLKDLKVILVDNMDQVLSEALEAIPVEASCSGGDPELREDDAGTSSSAGSQPGIH
jgi:ATP-dependent Lon protease